MKMVIKINTDGSEEIEGTPEEIAEYKRSLLDSKSHHDNHDCPMPEKQIITDYGGRVTRDAELKKDMMLLAFMR